MDDLKNIQPLVHQVYLIRHGDVEIPSGVCYGQLDCELTQSFESDVTRLTHYFKEKLLLKKKETSAPSIMDEEVLIISSPLMRCHQIASRLTKYLNHEEALLNTLRNKSLVSLQTNSAFKEIDFGEWEGASWDDIGQKNIDEWNANILDYTFPKGENARRFDVRVINAWDELLCNLSGQKKPKTVIIFSHAGVIRSILSHFLHIPLQNSLALTIDKMSLSHLRIIPQYIGLSRCLKINQSI